MALVTLHIQVVLHHKKPDSEITSEIPILSSIKSQSQASEAKLLCVWSKAAVAADELDLWRRVDEY